MSSDHASSCCLHYCTLFVCSLWQGKTKLKRVHHAGGGPKSTTATSRREFTKNGRTDRMFFKNLWLEIVCIQTIRDFNKNKESTMYPSHDIVLGINDQKGAIVLLSRRMSLLIEKSTCICCLSPAPETHSGSLIQQQLVWVLAPGPTNGKVCPRDGPSSSDVYTLRTTLPTTHQGSKMLACCSWVGLP